MPTQSLSRPHASSWRSLLALLCVVLALLAGTAQAVHIHADGTDLHPDCSLCVAAHVSVQVVPAYMPVAPLAVASEVETPEQARAAKNTPVFPQFIRPPPAV